MRTKGDAIAGGIVGVALHLRSGRGNGLRDAGQAGVGIVGEGFGIGQLRPRSQIADRIVGMAERGHRRGERARAMLQGGEPACDTIIPRNTQLSVSVKLRSEQRLSFFVGFHLIKPSFGLKPLKCV